MPTVCIQCAIRAMLEDKPPPVFDESPEEHASRCHSDAQETKRERVELERLLTEKLRTQKT